MKKLIAALLATTCALAGLTYAQTYPTKLVRIIVPYAAGGGNDLVARTLAQRLTETMGQSFIVENRVGAGGAIGMEAVAKSAPDGHTLLVAPNNLAIVPALFPTINIDPVRDFAPIVNLVYSPGMIGVNSAVPVKTLPELFALIKAHPGKYNWASCGTASPQHLAGELLASQVGLSMQHIPFNGCAPGVAEVAAGRVEILFGTVSHVLANQRSGRMKALATTGAKRSQVAPDYPTVAESGVPGYEADVWFAMFAPAKTPREVIMRLNTEVNRILQSPDIREKLTAQSFDIAGGTPEELAKIVQNDVARWGKVVRDLNIKVDAK